MRHKKSTFLVVCWVLMLIFAYPTATRAMVALDSADIQQQASSLWILILFIPMCVSAVLTTYWIVRPT